MLEKRSLIGTLFSFIVLIGLVNSCCQSKKVVLTNAEGSTAPIETQKEDIKKEEKEVNKVENNTINAILKCSNESKISLLQLSDKKYDTDDFICKVSRSSGIKIQWTSESKKLEIIFNIVGIETMMIKRETYKSKSTNQTQYLTVSLNSKALGQHNFGDNYEGSLEIIDYGSSSDIICGKFAVVDRKGNKIEGNFNETISMF